MKLSIKILLFTLALSTKGYSQIFDKPLYLNVKKWDGIRDNNPDKIKWRHMFQTLYFLIDNDRIEKREGPTSLQIVHKYDIKSHKIDSDQITFYCKNKRGTDIKFILKEEGIENNRKTYTLQFYKKKGKKERGKLRYFLQQI